MDNIILGDCIEEVDNLTQQVDLVYIDPPFFKQKDFEDKKGSFSDSWYNEEEYIDLMIRVLCSLRQKLKDTGSIYVHCDYTINYKIRGLLDRIFGRENFKNELLWCYEGGGNPTKKWKNKADTIYFYTKSDNYTFNQVTIPYDKFVLSGHIKKKLKTKEELDKYTEKRLEEGKLLNNWWADIPSFSSASNSKERVNYPTQKPVKLLERIIKASSDEGDIVLDCFAGSGTTGLACKNLNRNYILIDENPEAIKIMEERLNG